MSEGKPILFVGMACPAELEKEFNRWYDEVHVPLLLKSPCVAKATRYKIQDPDNQDPKGKFPNYISIYEFKSEQALAEFKTSPAMKEAAKDFGRAWGDKTIQPKMQMVAYYGDTPA